MPDYPRERLVPEGGYGSAYGSAPETAIVKSIPSAQTLEDAIAIANIGIHEEFRHTHVDVTDPDFWATDRTDIQGRIEALQQWIDDHKE